MSSVSSKSSASTTAASNPSVVHSSHGDGLPVSVPLPNVSKSESLSDSLAPVLTALTPARGFLSGVASGVSKLVVGHPFDTIKVRMQYEGGIGRFRGPLDCLFQTVRYEGIRALYKGATPPLFGWAAIDSWMWSVLLFLRGHIQQDWNHGSPLSLPQHLIAGIGAGLASTILVTPIEQVKARLQIQYHDPASRHYSGPIDCIRKLVRNNGLISGLYQGYAGTVLFRVFLGFYFAGYETTKSVLTPHISSAPTVNFLSGGIAATLMWCAAFPPDLIKNKMMGQLDVKPRKYPSVASVVKDVYAKEGLKGFYRGFLPCLLRSFPTNGAAFVAAESVLRWIPESSNSKAAI